jgi:SAM-dependent methyltransferase
VDNYEFCAEFAAKHSGRVLDYGCGEGQIVSLLLDRGIDAYGCDVFYEGGSFRGTNTERIRRMEGARIPFPDAHFDVVVHNQVFEHVPDLDVAASEIARVLKPGGLMLGIFPDRSVWREGHCGVPFLHWFPKGSNARVYYATAWRTLGLGYFHGTKSRRQWAADACAWLDQWTYYRTYDDIQAALKRHFAPMQHIEADWLVSRRAITSVVPPTLRAIVTRKLGGMVFVARRHEVAATI